MKKIILYVLGCFLIGKEYLIDNKIEYMTQHYNSFDECLTMKKMYEHNTTDIEWMCISKERRVK